MSKTELIFGVPDFKKPWLTFGILGLLTIIFICEMAFPVAPGTAMSPSMPTLIAFGGLNKTLVFERHEWFRIFTGPLLHGSIMHLLFNALALFFAGLFLERLVGRIWFLAIFVVGALSGAAMSLAVNTPHATSVGASGAIMGLFAALFVSSFRLSNPQERHRLQGESLRILIPSLLPMASSLHIDLGAHFGGALGGLAMGYLLLKIWREDTPLPPHRDFAAIFAAATILMFACSFVVMVQRYAGNATMVELIPQKEIPATSQMRDAQSNQLVTKYPDDPRAHIYKAEKLIHDQDLIGARFELETALTKAEKYRFMFGLKLENTVRAILAAIWISNNARSEAQKVAQPVCDASPADRPESKLYQVLLDQKLCN